MRVICLPRRFFAFVIRFVSVCQCTGSSFIVVDFLTDTFVCHHSSFLRRFVEEVDRGIGVKPHARFTHKHTWLPAPFLRDALSDVERYNANAKEGETAIRGRFIKNTTASATAGSRG